jgi:hypothetical protein
VNEMDVEIEEFLLVLFHENSLNLHSHHTNNASHYMMMMMNIDRNNLVVDA